jgi:hypothetical protein
MVLASSSPVFVVGFQRSGTTLLQTVIGAHPAFVAPPETYFDIRILQLASFYGDLEDDRQLRVAVQDTIDFPLLAGCGFDVEEVYERARRGPRTYGGLLDAVLSDLAARHGKRRWCEKTPGTPARRLWRVLPEARFVHIVRDPRSVVASSLKTPWTPRDPAFIAREWRVFTENNRDFARTDGAGRVLHVRYEDLVADPEPVVREVCEFVGEDFRTEMLDGSRRGGVTISPIAAPWQGNVSKPITPRADAPGSGLSTVERLQVEAVVAPLLERLGYEQAGRGLLAGRLLGALPRRSDIDRWRERRHAERARTPVARKAAVDRFVARRLAASRLPGGPGAG